MQKLYEKVIESSPLCLGIDPHWDLIPETLDGKYRLKERYGEHAKAYVYSIFCEELLKLLAPYIKIAKFQSAHFEACGPQGMYVLQSSMRLAKSLGYYVILDAKRGDISATAYSYAEAAFKAYDADALTVNPYMGQASIAHFAQYATGNNRDIFVVTNPTEEGVFSKPKEVLEYVKTLGERNLDKYGYGNVGAVMSGLFPNNLDNYRAMAPSVFFLIPGMGTQGGQIPDTVPAFKDGNGAILNYSRSLIYPHGGIWQDKIVEAAKELLALIGNNIV